MIDEMVLVPKALLERVLDDAMSDSFSDEIGSACTVDERDKCAEHRARVNRLREIAGIPE